MKRFFSVMCILFAMSLTSFATADQETEVKDMVQKAVSTYKEKGRDYTLKLINSTSGPFRVGELYVYATDLEGTVLAHPANRDLIGRNQAKLLDAKGKPFAQELLEIAKNSTSGWVEYTWLRVGEKEPTPKRAYVESIPGENIAFSAGYYVR